MTKPKTFRATTQKALAACHAVGLVYHGCTGSMLIAVDPDAQSYHWVRVSTRGGVTYAMHFCCDRRTELAAAAARTVTASREFTRTELALVAPSWLCDSGGEWVEVGDPAAALAEIWLEGRPA